MSFITKNILQRLSDYLLTTKTSYNPVIVILFLFIQLNSYAVTDLRQESHAGLHPYNTFGSDREELVNKAEAALVKGVEYFHTLNIHGGYVYNYLLDKSRKWGETEYFGNTIEVQPPGTPAVGESFISAYEVTEESAFLKYAEETAHALLAGQNIHGGWDHTINFDNEEKSDFVSFDDNQTQSAIRFLMHIDQYSDDPDIEHGVIKALKLMLKSQFESGAWPHYYPERGTYDDYATFNDGGINMCVDVMIDAYKYYQVAEYYKSIELAGKYIYISQLPPPQSGWAQQYNEFLQPVWARTFEPPSVCPMVTIRNINTLMDIYLLTEDDYYLEPIPDAVRWMNDSKLPNGKWARFVELGTNEPLYYDRGRIRVDSPEELSVERRLTYGYQQDLSEVFDSTVSKYESLKTLGSGGYKELLEKYYSSENYLHKLEQDVIQIINEQDEQGRWVSKNDRFKNKLPGKMWKGDFLNADRISSEKFNSYINKLSEFISAYRNLKD